MTPDRLPATSLLSATYRCKSCNVIEALDRFETMGIDAIRCPVCRDDVEIEPIELISLNLPEPIKKGFLF